jgi:DNA-binding CsgD family transcriptional regulator
MKLRPKIIGGLTPGFRLTPALTSEESMILRGLVAGKTDKEVRKSLRISASIFLRLLHDMWAKTGTTNKPGLLLWAKRSMNGGDQRVGRR